MDRNCRVMLEYTDLCSLEIDMFPEKECNLSLLSHKSSSKCSDGSSNNSNLTVFSPDKEISCSPEKSSISESHISCDLSFEQRRLPSEEKVAEYKVLLNKVSEAYVNWKTNEFVLNTIKTKSAAWVQQIEAITKASELHQKVCLKSEKGDLTSVLGLEEEDVRLFTGRSSTLFNKSAFTGHATEVVRGNISKLKLQKKSLLDEFGTHSMKAMAGVVSQDREEQLQLYRHLDDQTNHARQLVSSSHTMVDQLISLRQNSARHLDMVTYSLLRNKAIFLQTVTSILKERLEQQLYVDKNMKRAMDTLGDKLKADTREMDEELKVLHKTLVEYERKEAISEKYKEIVKECAKLKKQLQHKYQTLELLNDPNISF